MPIKILALDDDPAILSLVKSALQSDDVEVQTATLPEEAWRIARKDNPDIILLDLVMPTANGMELLPQFIAWNPLIVVVLLTGEYHPEYAVEAIQKGASDYLTKPVEIDLLQKRIGKRIEEIRKHRRVLELEEEFARTGRLGDLVGLSRPMLNVYARLERIAPHYRSVLITGETGTGKELAARALHSLSPVSSGPFVVCNCAALVETLFESELFGHTAGAFTGAVKDRAGLFETGNGGTVFLDEIGELPLNVQSKLLRVLQRHEVQRVGSSTVRPVDVRVIAATNRNLKDEIAGKQFREDLYYRLAVVEIHLPRLTDRHEDLVLLQRHFLTEYSKRYNKRIRSITNRAQAVLMRHTWPGNVRELENVIGHACMMAAGDVIDVWDLPDEFQGQKHDSVQPAAVEAPLTMAEAEFRHALSVLAQAGGNKQEAAEILGISRNTLYRILKDANPEKQV
ncbi:MAG: sigma-54-dependent Fis family transcriptional regulator [Candidatus Solibacter usitatus]|nr:sigma-54-dependent Fis family transcriptional regulator [Candidatus Solibacter usitatus]